MGAWGAEALENDGAMDRVHEIQEARYVTPVVEALEVAGEGGYPRLRSVAQR